jgi:hypothetical protein
MKNYLKKRRQEKKNMKRAAMFLLLTFFVSSTLVFAGEVKLMNKEDLIANLGNPDITILDVRLGKDWDSSEYKIKNAVHLTGNNQTSVMTTVSKDKTLVFYCA